MIKKIYTPSRPLQELANGLHSGTKFAQFDLGHGVKQAWHEHPETGELVIMNTEVVAFGSDGDVDFEFEVIVSYPRVACELAKMNGNARPVEIINGDIAIIKNYHVESI